MGDVVVRRPHLGDVERPVLHAAELIDLTIGGEDPRAVGPQLAVLDDDPELDGEPEHARQERDVVLVAQAVGRLAGEPVQLREGRSCEQMAVPDDLVDHVGLGRVERLRGVAHVLRRVEAPAREVAVELPQLDESRRGDVAEAGERLEAVGDLLEARDVVLGEAELRDALVELGDREVLVLGRQLAHDGPPDIVLGLRVADVGSRLAGAPRERQRGDLVAARPVRLVGEARVVGREVDLHAVVVVGDRGVELAFLEHARSAAPRPSLDKPRWFQRAECSI